MTTNKSKQVLESKHKEKQLPLEINLDEIKNPHPRVREAYKDTGDLFFPFEDNAEFNNEKRIFIISNGSKIPIKHKIVSIYRKKEGEKEYCFFIEHLMLKDYFQNPIDHTRTVGRYQYPNIVSQHGMNPDAVHDPTHPKEMGPSIVSTQIESVTFL